MRKKVLEKENRVRHFGNPVQPRHVQTFSLTARMHSDTEQHASYGEVVHTSDLQ